MKQRGVRRVVRVEYLADTALEVAAVGGRGTAHRRLQCAQPLADCPQLGQAFGLRREDAQLSHAPPLAIRRIRRRGRRLPVAGRGGGERADGKQAVSVREQQPGTRSCRNVATREEAIERAACNLRARRAAHVREQPRPLLLLEVAVRDRVE